MALEDLIREHIAELKRNTEALQKHNDLLTSAIATASAKTGAGTTAKADTTKSTTTKKTETAKAPAAPTHESLKTSIGAWIGEKAKGSDEAKERTLTAKKLFAHFGADKLPDIAADKLPDVQAFFDQIKAGEDPFPAEEEAAAEEESIL